MRNEAWGAFLMLMCVRGCDVRCDGLLGQRLAFFWTSPPSPSASVGQRTPQAPCAVCLDTLSWLVFNGLILETVVHVDD